ncbi:MAG: YraN family protein [Salaquimonas sp.]
MTNKPAKNRTGQKARQNAQRYGIWTEHFAAFALRLKGYRIIARNYRVKSGEIDIIAKRRDLIAIVEVKARKSLNQSVDAVGYQNQQRVRAAANWWLSTRKDAHLLSVRFDIVAVQPWKWPVHLENAF